MVNNSETSCVIWPKRNSSPTMVVAPVWLPHGRMKLFPRSWNTPVVQYCRANRRSQSCGPRRKVGEGRTRLLDTVNQAPTRRSELALALLVGLREHFHADAVFSPRNEHGGASPLDCVNFLALGRLDDVTERRQRFALVSVEHDALRDVHRVDAQSLVVLSCRLRGCTAAARVRGLQAGDSREEEDELEVEVPPAGRGQS